MYTYIYLNIYQCIQYVCILAYICIFCILVKNSIKISNPINMINYRVKLFSYYQNELKNCIWIFYFFNINFCYQVRIDKDSTILKWFKDFMTCICNEKNFNLQPKYPKCQSKLEWSWNKNKRNIYVHTNQMILKSYHTVIDWVWGQHFICWTFKHKCCSWP